MDSLLEEVLEQQYPVYQLVSLVVPLLLRIFPCNCRNILHRILLVFPCRPCRRVCSCHQHRLVYLLACHRRHQHCQQVCCQLVYCHQIHHQVCLLDHLACRVYHHHRRWNHRVCRQVCL